MATVGRGQAGGGGGERMRRVSAGPRRTSVRSGPPLGDLIPKSSKLVQGP